MLHLLNKKNLIILISTSILFSGCATILSGDRQKLTIHSMPTNAFVSIDGRLYGKTPLEVEIKKGLSKVTLQKDGYYPTVFSLESKLDSNTLWGIYPLVGLPITTDMSQGNTHIYSPSFYKIDLKAIDK